MHVRMPLCIALCQSCIAVYSIVVQYSTVLGPRVLGLLLNRPVVHRTNTCRFTIEFKNEIVTLTLNKLFAISKYLYTHTLTHTHTRLGEP